MGATATYFRHLKEAVTSIFDGMAVSASHLIRRPYTIQYPDRIPVRVQDTLPFRYRGILDVDMEICTGCLACDRACPINCIAIAIEKNAQTREIVISQFDIDMAKCMYCGLCSEPCPTGAIHHTTEFEGADFSLESLIRRFITEPVVAYKAKKGPEPDAEVAGMLDRGMKYVDEWAQPGSDKPPVARPTVAPRPVAAAAKPALAAQPGGPDAAKSVEPAPKATSAGLASSIDAAPTVAAPSPSESSAPAHPANGLTAVAPPSGALVAADPAEPSSAKPVTDGDKD